MNQANTQAAVTVNTVLARAAAALASGAVTLALLGAIVLGMTAPAGSPGVVGSVASTTQAA